MKTQIQSLHFTADQKLLDFIENKFNKIEKFDDTLTSGDVIMRLDKDEQEGNKVVVIKLLSKGADMVAERRAKSFEMAIDECFEALKKQIDRRRG